MATLAVDIPANTKLSEAIRALNNSSALLNDKERATATVGAVTITVTYDAAPRPKEGVQSVIAVLDANPSGLTQQQVTSLRATLASINFPV